MVAILATVLGALAALVHVYIFVLESIRWRTPRVWRGFGVTDQATADAIRPMAYNQGFYNLFLAIGAALGLVLFWVGEPGTVADVAGRTLALFSLGSMAAAALVLVTTGRRYLRAAALQGLVPPAAFVLFVLA
jgi:putative membrane protein